jgi:hypothetical protein
MTYVRFIIIVLLALPAAVTVAHAGDRKGLRHPVAVSKHAVVSRQVNKQEDKGSQIAGASSLDRIATAVDAVESNHGQNMAMWRPNLAGPQGPMQVSEAAAIDVGGGDRLDRDQNRAIGRAYLEQLYRRYKNWPDAIAAYNWGIGKMDAWVKAGRPPDKFLVSVASYLRRVLDDSGLCRGSEPTRPLQAERIASSSLATGAMLSIQPMCAATFGSWYDQPYAGRFIRAYGRRFAQTYGARFVQAYSGRTAPPKPRSPLKRLEIAARSSWLTAMRDSFGCGVTQEDTLDCR